MRRALARPRILLRVTSLLVLLLFIGSALPGQCPEFTSSSITGNAMPLCEGESVTLSIDAINIAPGSQIDWYIGAGMTFDPYNGEGELIGSVLVEGDPCVDAPEILYIMVNPDNGQVGGSGDQCDEFIVLWTGSGGFSTTDILVTNLGPGTFQWDSFIAGNAATFSCGIALPPGAVPPNAILIIQSSTANNVPIDSDVLCASGLPVYIISYDGTVACTGGYFDNNAPCSSCPVMMDITGSTCQYDFELDYQPPGSSIDGWAWANTGSGVYADVIPPLDIPVPGPADLMIDDFVWTIPSDFCETMGGGSYFITGIPDPPPMAGCMEITTPFYGLDIVCPELIISGGGEVCVGNCPENPTLISFELSGGDYPFIVDLVIIVPIFGSFPIDDIEIALGQTIQVCLEGILPSFDPSTGTLYVPELAVGFSTSVEVVSAESASGCPIIADPNSITLTFIDAPSANAGPDQTICSGDNVNLSGNIGGSASESTWTTSGDGDFDDPTDLNTSYTPGPGDIATGNVTLILTAVDENGSCTPEESTLEITITESVSVETNGPDQFCDNGDVAIEALVTGGPQEGEWETTGDGDFDDPENPETIYTPGPNDILNGSVTLIFNPSASGDCIGLIEPLIIAIVHAPEVSHPPFVEICVGDSAMYTINVTGEFNYADIVWFGTGGTTEVQGFDVLYIPSQSEIDNQFAISSFTVPSIYPECGETTYNVQIFITDCDCPPFMTDAPSESLCFFSDTLDLSTLLIAGGGGEWTITGNPPGGNSATIDNDLFITNNSDWGSYMITYTLSNPEPGCPATSSEVVSVLPFLTPQLGPDIQACSGDTVDLTLTFSIGAPSQYVWETSGNGTFINIDVASASYVPGPMDVSQNVNIIYHVIDYGCGTLTDTLTIDYLDSPQVLFIGDTVTICNASGMGSVVSFPSLITGGDMNGTWVNISGVPVDFSNPAAVDFTGIAVGVYPFGYTTNSAMPPCPETSYTVYIAIEACSCPFIMTQNVPDGICNDLAQLPLNAFIQAGAPGSWQVITAPPGANPATLTGDDLQINGRDPGAYLLRFTFDAAPLIGCPDSAEITLSLQDVPELVLLNDTLICSDQTLALQPMIGGSTTNVDWSTTGTGTFAPDPGLMTSYTFSVNDIISRRVYLIATSMDTSGFCPLRVDSVEVNIVEKAYIIWSQLNDEVCNNPDSGSVLNLLPYIIDGDINPDWSVGGSGAIQTGTNQFDFAGVAPGIYTFVATTNNSAFPCDETSYDFIITVVDCFCPAIEITTDSIKLCEPSTFDLSTYVVNAAPGTWSITQSPAGSVLPVIANDILNTTNGAEGVYTITYALTDSVSGCPASVQVPLLIETLPIITITNLQCDDDKTTYEAWIQTDGSALTSDFGVVADIGSGQFRITQIPVDQDIMVTVFSAFGLCSRTTTIPAPDCSCTLFTEEIADTIFFCPGDTVVLIPIIMNAQGLPFSTWVTPHGSEVKPSLQLYEPGQYIWIVLDSALCENRDTFHAVFIGPVDALISTVSPTCPESTDGQLIIESVEEGTPPFRVQVDNGAQLTINLFPFVIDQVGLGAHVVTIFDVIGCSLEFNVTIDNQDFGSVDLGPNSTVIKGDSTLITPVVIDIEVSSVTWNLSSIPQDVSPFFFTPVETITIEVEITDTAGCIYTDELLITVIEEELFYFPNIFSPNDDQINDQMEIITNLQSDRLVSLDIFDRWGSLLFAQTGNPPYRWNGKSNDKFVNPGVYVYRLLYKDERGIVQVKRGDVTVIR